MFLKHHILLSLNKFGFLLIYPNSIPDFKSSHLFLLLEYFSVIFNSFHAWIVMNCNWALFRYHLLCLPSCGTNVQPCCSSGIFFHACWKFERRAGNTAVRDTAMKAICQVWAWAAQLHRLPRGQHSRTMPHVCRTGFVRSRSCRPAVQLAQRVRKSHVCGVSGNCTSAGMLGKNWVDPFARKNTMFRANPNVQISSLIENVPFPMRSNSCQLQKTIAQQHITIHYSRTSIYTSWGTLTQPLHCDLLRWSCKRQ